MLTDELPFVFEAGAIFVAMGLAPRLLQGLEEGIRELSAQLFLIVPMSPRRAVDDCTRVWLVSSGIVLMLTGVALTFRTLVS